MVDGLLVAFVFYEPVIFVTTLTLLPLEVNEHGAILLGLHPGCASLHDPPDEGIVIASAHIILR